MGDDAFGVQVPAHQVLQQLLHVPQGGHPGAVQRDLLVDQHLGHRERDLAALADEGTPPPGPGVLQRDHAGGAAAGTVDARLAAATVGELPDYAPTIVPDAATATALRQVPEVARTLRQFGSVTKAVVGIGLWAPTESTVYDATEEDVRDALHDRGARGEIAGAIVDSAGHPVGTDLPERMICPSADQLRAIPEVLAIAYNRVRSPAVTAAIRGGLVDSLVTHASLARTLLEEAEDAHRLP